MQAEGSSIVPGDESLGIGQGFDIRSHPCNHGLDVTLFQRHRSVLQALEELRLGLLLVFLLAGHLLDNLIPDRIVQGHQRRSPWRQTGRKDAGARLGGDTLPAPVALAVAILDDGVSALLSPSGFQSWLQVILVHVGRRRAVPSTLDDMPHDDLVLGHCGSDGHRWQADEAVLLTRLREAIPTGEQEVPPILVNVPRPLPTPN